MHAPLRKPYVPPAVSSDLGNAGAVAIRNNQNAVVKYCDNIDGSAVEQLAQQFGSPLFVFSEKTIREKAQHMKRAFRSRYPDTRFFWSVKTNYLNAICNLFTSENWGMECVSSFEMSKAERNGVRGENLICNGPCWSKADLCIAMESGALVQIDHRDESGTVEEIAATMSRPVDVGIRIAIDNGLAPFCSKFGFDLDNGEASHAIVRVLPEPAPFAPYPPHTVGHSNL